MDILEAIHKRGVEALGRYYSVYRARVIDNEDSTHRGRLKVFLPDVLNGVTALALPKSIIGDLSTGMKPYVIPRVGSIVYVEFQSGDVHRPLWSYHGFTLGNVPGDLADNNALGIVTPSGQKIILNDDKGVLYITMVDPSDPSNVEKRSSFVMSHKGICINGGKNGGVLNRDSFDSMVEAILKDLLALGSGTNLSTWFGSERSNLEDKKFLH